MPNMPVPPKFQSPLGSNNNDGALPTAYDPNWPTYVNLTPAQIVAFQKFPQDLLRYAAQRRWEAMIIETDPKLMTAIPTLANIVANLFAAHDRVISSINSNTITSRSQIDAAFASIAPNSPSALNPSVT